MATVLDWTFSSLALLLALLAWGAAGDPETLARVLLGSDHGNRTSSSRPMVLPLVFSIPNSSRHRRQLAVSGGTAEARMRLYDDLLNYGYYTTRLLIGTPPQKFALIVDTGSTVTYVPCSTCEQCGNHQDPRFQPDRSSTYKPVKCNIDCNCDREKDQCVYERQYAEMSSSSGVLGEDIISFGKESQLVPQRAVFGCENAETGDLYSQRADGIMGLGRGQLSIMDQLVDKGVISDSFSLCYGGMDVGGGAMVLGRISPPPGMIFSYSNPVRSPYYNIDLKEIHVSGKPLNLNPRVFDRKYGSVLDSGTTYAYLPEVAYLALKNAIMKQLHSLKQIPGPDPKFKDICFSGAGRDVSELSKSFPKVDMVFGRGQKIALSPENYLFRHSKVHGGYCLGIFPNGKDPTTLLGGIIVRNTLVTYDRKNDRIGFLKTNCSELGEKMHPFGAPPPEPSPPPPPAPSPAPAPGLSPAASNSSSWNLTTGPSPAPSPTGLQDHILKGEFQIGFITFDMYLSIKYSNLVPHIAELTELLAHQIEVNVSQVEMLSFRSVENGSLIRWAIFPAESNFISNSTAMAIISRLTEHRVQLPENFGSYHLVEWKVEPLSKRTWWQQHIFLLFLGGLAVLVFSSSAFLVLYLYRRKRRLNAYRPVDAPVPEQELQPL